MSGVCERNETADGLNAAAWRLAQHAIDRAAALNAAVHRLGNGATLIDCGVQAPGSLAAGLVLARLCLAGQAEVQLVNGDRTVWPGPWIEVRTDAPVRSCMLSQYAGWPIETPDGQFFGMGSGPMRVRRGKEELLRELGAEDQSSCAVGVVEADQLPDEALVDRMAKECGVESEQLILAVAPTRSIAGVVQVVARSVETCLHKLHVLGGDLKQVVAGWGLAPLAPPTPDLVAGIGRTNDAILFAGQVTLWVHGDDAPWEQLVGLLPSAASGDFGVPFAEVFRKYDLDFYRIDPHLFAPAEVMVINGRSGSSWHAGKVHRELLRRSFDWRESDLGRGGEG
ncbi:MAG: methenyltetrahydromethanopterin cyclohydrolase [Pirellulaceae bacterium]|nr:MAG: methenyltetrahydromethanopterin cyclohydrolase [Pirellulaceae bacterium]